MDLGIKGKRALLLAASSGLGFASALSLAREGVHVCVSSADGDRAIAAAQRITDETGTSTCGLAGDLSDPTNMDTLLSTACSAMGGAPDILFLNHGGPPLRKAVEVSEDELASHANMMMFSLIRMVQMVVPAMRKRAWGRVILVGAPAIGEPIHDNVLSNIYRGGIANYCKTLAAEVIADGVTVNIVSPSAVRTERTLSTAEQRGALKGVSGTKELADREAATLSRRFGTPEEFGDMVTFISSDRAGYTTGTNIRVDGGAARGIS